jgi:hypothetical protein
MINKFNGFFTAEDEVMLQAFTQHAAVALMNSSLYSEVKNVKTVAGACLIISNMSFIHQCYRKCDTIIVENQSHFHFLPCVEETYELIGLHISVFFSCACVSSAHRALRRPVSRHPVLLCEHQRCRQGHGDQCAGRGWRGWHG